MMQLTNTMKNRVNLFLGGDKKETQIGGQNT